MCLIVCLGNPGAKYNHTRHNVGFRVGEYLLNADTYVKIGQKFEGILYERQGVEKKIRLLFPQTYMNLSGRSVKKCLSFYKIPMQDLIVIYDDFDIAFPSIRIRPKGSAGTHNGMKSIIAETGSTDFARLRIGIGPKPEFFDVSSFVLSDFSKEEEKALPDIFEKAHHASKIWIKEGTTAAMNRFNAG